METQQAERNQQNQEMDQRNKAVNTPIKMTVNEAFGNKMPVTSNPHPVPQGLFGRPGVLAATESMSFRTAGM